MTDREYPPFIFVEKGRGKAKRMLIHTELGGQRVSLDTFLDFLGDANDHYGQGLVFRLLRDRYNAYFPTSPYTNRKTTGSHIELAFDGGKVISTNALTNLARKFISRQTTRVQDQVAVLQELYPKVASQIADYSAFDDEKEVERVMQESHIIAQALNKDYTRLKGDLLDAFIRAGFRVDDTAERISESIKEQTSTLGQQLAAYAASHSGALQAAAQAAQASAGTKLKLTDLVSQEELAGLSAKELQERSLGDLTLADILALKNSQRAYADLSKAELWGKLNPIKKKEPVGAGRKPPRDPREPSGMTLEARLRKRDLDFQRQDNLVTKIAAEHVRRLHAARHRNRNFMAERKRVVYRLHEADMSTSPGPKTLDYDSRRGPYNQGRRDENYDMGIHEYLAGTVEYKKML